MVIVDSSVWSSFQRDPNSSVGCELDSLLADDEIVMIGPVLTEILRGNRSEGEFAHFSQPLKSLAFLNTDQNTWIQAGELNFQLKREGLPLALSDLIVSALAIQHDIPLYTIDGDFQ